jgi:rhodanese-related sulfurtransferase
MSALLLPAISLISKIMGLKTISAKDLHLAIQNQRVTVIDVNARHRWQAAHIPGAINLDTQFSASDLPADTAHDLVFYCSNPLCRKAPNAARRAMQLGYQHVHVMSAGISGWMDFRLPTEAGRVESAPRFGN